MNIFQNISNNQFFNFGNIFSKILYLDEFEKISYLNNYLNLASYLFIPENIIPLDEKEEKNNCKEPEFEPNLSNNKPKKNIFKVEYPDNISLFTESESTLNIGEQETFIFKRHKRLARKYSKDNIRKKIKREFFNNMIITKLNEKLKSIGSKLYFIGFPQSFVGDIKRSTNKEILYLTLGKIFETKEIINPKNAVDLDKYEHNLKVIKSPDVNENEEFQKILNMRYCELFEEYLNSDEFKVNVFNKLKRKNLDNDYIKKYQYLSKHFLSFFSELKK